MNMLNITSSDIIIINNVEELTTVLEWHLRIIFIFLLAIVAATAFFIHRAIYRTFERLGKRHINIIVIPSMASTVPYKIINLFHDFVFKDLKRSNSIRKETNVLATCTWHSLFFVFKNACTSF